MYVDALVLAVLYLPLGLLEVALQHGHRLLLVAHSVLVVSLLYDDLVLEGTGAALEVSKHLLKYLVVTVTRLVVLDLLTVGQDDAVTRVIWGTGAAGIEGRGLGWAAT